MFDKIKENIARVFGWDVDNMTDAELDAKLEEQDSIADLNAVNEKVSDLEAKNADLEAKLNEANGKADEVKEEVDEKGAKVVEDVKSVIKNFKAEMNAALEAVQNENKDLKEANENIESSIKDINTSISEFAKAFNKQKITEKSNEVEGLQNDSNVFGDLKETKEGKVVLSSDAEKALFG